MADKKAGDIIEVTANNLPLYCPGPHAPHWSMHPRVFLDIAHTEDHTATCPYCSAKYKLKDGEKVKGH